MGRPVGSFFFQAEDGIRDIGVTGVQTCALPISKEAIVKSRYIVGYKYPLSTIEAVIDRSSQQVFQVTMQIQEGIYQDIYAKMKDGEYCTVPFTGDVNFSESEVVDRLLEIFGSENVEVIPGISSIQVAAAKAHIPTDKAFIVTFHVTDDIEAKKQEMLQAIRQDRSIILLPRPWPTDRSKIGRASCRERV